MRTPICVLFHRLDYHRAKIFNRNELYCFCEKCGAEWREQQPGFLARITLHMRRFVMHGVTIIAGALFVLGSGLALGWFIHP